MKWAHFHYRVLPESFMIIITAFIDKKENNFLSTRNIIIIETLFTKAPLFLAPF